jgi:hypothetical protein
VRRMTFGITKNIIMRSKAFAFTLLLSSQLNWVEAQEVSDPVKRAGQAMYSFMEERARQSMDEKLSAMRNQKRVDGKPLSTKDLTLIEFNISAFEYQHVVDMVLCAEESVYRTRSDPDAFRRCQDDKVESSREFFTFLQNYADLLQAKGIAVACEAKARLITLETRYPPYSFMTARPLYAFDTRGYLECARARL